MEFTGPPEHEVEFLRILQNVEEAATNETAEELIPPRDSTVIADTLQVYGSIYIILLLIFCFVRRRYPRVYNVRSWSPDLKTDLASDQFGFFDWFWKVWFIDDDEFRQQTGMDTLCFIRIFRMGLKIALIGVFNSLWLMPLYGTAPSSEKTDHVTDPVALLSIRHVPQGSSRLVGTVLAAYISFGFTMYMILKEFEWFTEHRHKYLSERVPRNYSIYVSHIPLEYRSSAKLLEYFRNCFSRDDVLEAHIGLNIPHLEHKVAHRNAVINKLEHAINIEEVKGTTPTQGGLMPGSAKVNAIDALSEELRVLNEEIRNDIAQIEKSNEPRTFKEDFEAEAASVKLTGGGGASIVSGSMSNYQTNDLEMKSFDIHIPIHEDKTDGPEGKISDDSETKSGLMNSFKDVAGGLANSAHGGLSKGMKMLMGPDEGSPRESGFVSFARLSTSQAALQMVHSHIPFAMEVAEAPNPDDVFWPNVGKTHEQLQIGFLISLGLTVTLCLFWTIPIAFIQSLTSVEGLTKTLPFLRKWVEDAPWLEEVLAQLAPLILIAIKALLPIILTEFSKLEGPVSSSVLEASLFLKLAMFELIQTFFVSTLSGSLTKRIGEIFNDVKLLVPLLANSLSGQSTFFVQLLLVQTFLSQALELLRVAPIAIAFIRSKVGPNLTEKEKNTTWMGLRPFADPLEFEFADVTSNAILYWMVLFVYAPLSPVSCWFLAFCFCILISGYRHQMIYIYPTTPDSGGKLWLNFINIALTSMLIAEVAILGILSLKRSTIAAPMMFPLIIVTILFNFYIRQRHFTVPNRVPSRNCHKIDLKRRANEDNFAFLKNQFRQPALQSDDVFPENFTVAREMEQGQIKFMTPPSSECEIITEEDFGYQPMEASSVIAYNKVETSPSKN